MDLNAARKRMLASSSVFRDLPLHGNREVKKQTMYSTDGVANLRLTPGRVFHHNARVELPWKIL